MKEGGGPVVGYRNGIWPHHNFAVVRSGSTWLTQVHLEPADKQVCVCGIVWVVWDVCWCLLLRGCRRRRRWPSWSWTLISECGSGACYRRVVVSCSRFTDLASPGSTTSATAVTWMPLCKSSWLYRSLNQSKPLLLINFSYSALVV